MMKKSIDPGVIHTLGKAGLIFKVLRERWEHEINNYDETVGKFLFGVFNDALMKPLMEIEDDKNSVEDALDSIEKTFQEAESQAIIPHSFDRYKFRSDLTTFLIWQLIIAKKVTSLVRGDMDYLNKCLDDANAVADHIAAGGTPEELDLEYIDYEKYSRDTNSDVQTGLNITKEDFEKLSSLEGVSLDEIMSKIEVNMDNEDFSFDD